jgi:hypothetical protein
MEKTAQQKAEDQLIADLGNNFGRNLSKEPELEKLVRAAYAAGKVVGSVGGCR